MSKIKIMDEILANKIAAGEVVERCVSVVKELVENSIDAGSSEIKVELIEAGTKSIKVIDNGYGMDKEDAVNAFSRHATSKLISEYDLYHINTLGFRGEALASIASVSEINLKTCSSNIGTSVNIKGGKLINVGPCEAIKGTIIEVKDLFYNTPARLKYLKSLYTELASITEYMNKIALSYPNIRFTLINNNNTILKTDGRGNLLKTISDIYGIEVAKKMLEINGEDDDYVISGYISKPEVNRSNRNHIITLVNNRVVRNTELNRVINDSYHSYKPDDRYPIVVINISVDPILIDVNIHPTKMDIKFSKMEELTSLISYLIKETLKKQILMVTFFEPKNDFVEPKNTYIETNFESKSNLDIEYNQPKYEQVKIEELPIIENEIKNEITYKESFEEKPLFVSEDENRLPIMEAVGLVHGTYIIAQNSDGMYLIDQHAAKERINYEMVLDKLKEPANKNINLLVPITLEFSNNEYIILKENLDLLVKMGFEVEEFGINSIIIKAHPVWLPRGFEKDNISKIIDLIINKEKDFSLEKFNDRVSATVACKMSIKANTNISIEEMNALLNDLRSCKNPFNCPHGRPTVIYYSNYDLEKLFKRSGFEKIN